MATTVLGLKTFAASDPVDYNEINDNYNKIDNGVKTAFQGRAAHNLLDNSDFRNPVNQRGKSSYTGSYSIDRWHASGSGSVSLSSGGITVSGVSFRQLVILPAGTYTLAFKVSNGTLLYYNFTYDGASTITKIGGANETTGAYINLYNNANGVVACQFVLGADYTYTLEWAALYEGTYTAETLPDYVPKGYAAELAECRRYYYQSWDGSKFNKGYITREAISASSLALIEFPTEMRIVPTITFYTAANETGVVKEWTTSSSVSATQNYTSTKAFGVVGEGNFTIGKTYFFHYTASADL